MQPNNNNQLQTENEAQVNNNNSKLTPIEALTILELTTRTSYISNDEEKVKVFESLHSKNLVVKTHTLAGTMYSIAIAGFNKFDEALTTIEEVIKVYDNLSN